MGTSLLGLVSGDGDKSNEENNVELNAENNVELNAENNVELNAESLILVKAVQPVNEFVVLNKSSVF